MEPPAAYESTVAAAGQPKMISIAAIPNADEFLASLKRLSAQRRQSGTPLIKSFSRTTCKNILEVLEKVPENQWKEWEKMDLAHHLWTAKRDTNPDMPSWEFLLRYFMVDKKLTSKIWREGKELIENEELFSQFKLCIPINGCTREEFQKLKREFCFEFSVNTESLDILVQPPEQPSSTLTTSANIDPGLAQPNMLSMLMPVRRHHLAAAPGGQATVPPSLVNTNYQELSWHAQDYVWK